MTPPIQRLAPDVLLLTGDAIGALAYAVAVTQRARARNGLPTSRALAALASAAGQADTQSAPELDTDEELITTEEAAQMLGISNRQARRRAPQLGGRLTGGRWLLDRRAVLEHQEGTAA